MSIYGLESTDSCLDAASRILRCEYNNIVAAADAMYVREATDPLHDLRVGIRKFRAAIRYFSPWLSEHSLDEIDQQLAELADILSPARDNDAWLEYLNECSIYDQLKKERQFTSYLEALRIERWQQLPGLRHTLDEYFSDAFRDSIVDALYRQTNQFLIDEISPPYEQFGCQRLGKYYKKLIRLDDIKIDSPPEFIHTFRKKCRRGRYWSEFTVSVGQATAKRLARYFKSLATAIGTARDMQLHIVQMHEDGIVLPSKFYRWQRAIEKEAWHDIKTTWKKLTSEKMQHQVESKLNA